VTESLYRWVLSVYWPKRSVTRGKTLFPAPVHQEGFEAYLKNAAITAQPERVWQAKVWQAKA